MKKPALTLFAALSFMTAAPQLPVKTLEVNVAPIQWYRGSDDRFFSNDKIPHFVCSSLLLMSFEEGFRDYNIKQAELCAFAATFAVGCFKEFVIDKSPSYKDLTANIAGAVAGHYLNILFNRWFNGIKKQPAHHRLKHAAKP